MTLVVPHAPHGLTQEPGRSGVPLNLDVDVTRRLDLELIQQATEIILILNEHHFVEKPHQAFLGDPGRRPSGTFIVSLDALT